MSDRNLSADTLCDTARLEDYLAGRADAAVMEAVELHLEHCVACRQRIEQRAAAPDFWQAAAEQLDTRSEIDRDTSRIEVVLDADDFDGTWKAESDLSLWLAPSDQLDSLGRIDQYEVKEVIGMGGMGLVLRAWDPELRREVAIKTMRQYLAANAQARQRFAREAQIAASLRHPNVIPIFHVGSWRSVHYIVMPLVEQGSLSDHVKTGRLTIDEIILVAHQIAQGLAAAHRQGLVHRDIKPSNILLLGGLKQVALADFGLARVLGEDRLTVSGTLNGTPQFMSPEQASGEAIDTHSDLFSLGSLLYWMGTSQSPFAAENQFGTLSKLAAGRYTAPSELRPDLPPWFDRLLAQLLVKQPQSARLPAEELAQLLERIAQYRQNPVAYPLPRSLAKPPGRRVRAAVLIALAAVLLVGLLGWLAGIAPRASETHREQAGREQAEGTAVAPPQEISQPEIPDTNIPESAPAALPVADRTVAVVTPTRTGPLDELDRLNLIADLKAGAHLEYWLSRLAVLPARETPPEAIHLIEPLGQSGEPAIRELAEGVLKKNPFEEIE